MHDDRARRPCTTHKDRAPCILHHGPCTAMRHAPCTMTVHRTPRVTHHGPRTMTVHHDRDRAPRPCTTQNDHAPCTSHSPQRTTDQAPCAGHTPSSPGAWGPGTGAGCDPAGPHIAARAHGCSGAAEEDGGCVLAPAGRLHQGPPPLVSTAGPARGPGAAASCIYSCSAPRHRRSAGRCQPRLSSGGSAPRGVPAVLPALVPGAAGSAVQDMSITIPVIPQWPPAALSLIRPGGSESSRGHPWGGGPRPLCPRAP